MRAGSLNTRVTLLSERGSVLGRQAISIDESLDGGGGPGMRQQTGTVSARYSPAVFSGCYWLADDGRRYLIGAVTNPDGKRRELRAGVTRLAGSDAVIDPDGGPVQVLCKLLSYRAVPESEYSYLPADTERRQAEFSPAFYAPGPGDEFVVDGGRYKALQLDVEHCTDAVARLWIEFLHWEPES